MIERLGRAATFGMAAAAVTLIGLAGAASAGMAGDTARSAGSTVAHETVAVAEANQTALGYGRGMVEMAAGETAQKADRAAAEASTNAGGGSEDGRPQARPVQDALDQVSRTGAEAERTIVDTARAGAAAVVEASETLATTLDEIEQ